MTLNPEVQKKAQEEIFRVVGEDRLPGFADRDNLPYVGALIKEVLRWNPVGPLGESPSTIISLPLIAHDACPLPQPSLTV